MPLLGREDCLYPSDLLSPAQRSISDDVCWWVLHTRPRTEKALARRFCRFRQAFFLPLYEKQWCHRGRRQKSYLPLFPGYVFLWGDSEARLRALETNLVAQVLPVADQARLEEDLLRVHRLIVSGSSLTPEDNLQPGRWVTITAGSLAGVEGRILRRGSSLRLLVEVQLLQRGVSVELEEWMIEPIDEPRGLASGRGAPVASALSAS